MPAIATQHLADHWRAGAAAIVWQTPATLFWCVQRKAPHRLLAPPGLLAPLMFASTENFMAIVLPTAIIIVILRRLVLPRVLERMVLKDLSSEPLQVAPTPGQPGG